MLRISDRYVLKREDAVFRRVKLRQAATALTPRKRQRYSRYSAVRRGTPGFSLAYSSRRT